MKLMSNFLKKEWFLIVMLLAIALIVALFQLL